ncbi:hypothetical protein DBV14_33065, partial [Variovorax sp. KBW07]
MLASRPGSGYYVLHRPSRATLEDTDAVQCAAEPATGQDRPPPAEYRGDELVREAMRRVARAAP